ncbi:hypothetical protein BGZ65_001102, partial [Modicella reniformis]
LKCRRTNGSVEDVGRRLAAELRDIFGPAAITIHLDGRQCAEKEKAREEREARRSKGLEKLQLALTAMEHNSDKGTWTPRKTIRKIDQGLKAVFQLSMQDKNELSMGLSADSAFHICRCVTEADVCIGHGTNPGSVAISRDSDMLIYANVSTVIRPLPKRRRAFGVYEKNQVLQALELPSPQHL